MRNALNQGLQTRFIKKAYEEAVEDGNWPLAARIIKANPSAFPRTRAR